MKFCQHCGKEVLDRAAICMNCGCAIQRNQAENRAVPPANNQTYASLVLGIVGIIFAWVFALVGHITSIIGIVLGAKAYKATNKMSGLVVSIIGEICSIISSVMGVVLVMSAYNTYI